MSKLVWEAPSAGETPVVVDGYIVRFCDAAAPEKVYTFTTANTSVDDIEGELNLVPGRKYSFKVSAFNKFGESPSTPDIVWEYAVDTFVPPANVLPEKKGYFLIALPPGMLTPIG